MIPNRKRKRVNDITELPSSKRKKGEFKTISQIKKNPAITTNMVYVIKKGKNGENESGELVVSNLKQDDIEKQKHWRKMAVTFPKKKKKKKKDSFFIDDNFSKESFSAINENQDVVFVDETVEDLQELINPFSEELKQKKKKQKFLETGYKRKRLINYNDTWELQEFHPRMEGNDSINFKLKHWVPYIEQDHEQKKDMFIHNEKFGRFEGRTNDFSILNERPDVFLYSDEEYQLITNVYSSIPVKRSLEDQWSKKETDELFELCKRYDLNFILVHDNFSTSKRSLLELKKRYFSFSRALLYLRSGCNLDLVYEHPLMSSFIDYSEESKRRKLLLRYFNEADTIKRLEQIEQLRKNNNKKKQKKLKEFTITQQEIFKIQELENEEIRKKIQSMNLTKDKLSEIQKKELVRSRNDFLIGNTSSSMEIRDNFRKILPKKQRRLSLPISFDKNQNINTNNISIGYLNVPERMCFKGRNSINTILKDRKGMKKMMLKNKEKVVTLEKKKEEMEDKKKKRKRKQNFGIKIVDSSILPRPNKNAKRFKLSFKLERYDAKKDIRKHDFAPHPSILESIRKKQIEKAKSMNPKKVSSSMIKIPNLEKRKNKRW